VPLGSVTKNQSEMASVTRRLISSGIVMSPLRRTRLDVGDRDAQLLGDDGAGERGVHITDHQHRIGALRLAQLLEGEHDLGRLLRVRAAAGAQAHVGLGNAQFLEEHVVHVPVVVLTGVHDLPGEAAVGLERTHDGCDLHEVGPGAGDEIETATRGHLRPCSNRDTT